MKKSTRTSLYFLGGGATLLILAYVMFYGLPFSFVPTNLPEYDHYTNNSLVSPQGITQVAYGQPVVIDLMYSNTPPVWTEAPNWIDCPGNSPYNHCGTAGYFAYTYSLNLNSIRFFVDGIDYSSSRRFQVNNGAGAILQGSGQAGVYYDDSPLNNPPQTLELYKTNSGISSGCNSRTEVEPPDSQVLTTITVPQYLSPGNHTIDIIYYGGTAGYESGYGNLNCHQLSAAEIANGGGIGCQYIYYNEACKQPNNQYNRIVSFEFEVLPSQQNSQLPCSGTLDGVYCTVGESSLNSPYDRPRQQGFHVSGCPVGSAGFGGLCRYKVYGFPNIIVEDNPELLAQLQEANATIAEQIAIINAIYTNLQDREQQLIETQALLQQYNVSIQLQAEIIAGLANDIEDRDAVIAAMTQILNDQSLTLEERAEMINALNLSLAERNEIIAGLNLTIEEQNQLIQLLQQQGGGGIIRSEDIALYVVGGAAAMIILFVILRRMRKI